MVPARRSRREISQRDSLPPPRPRAVRAHPAASERGSRGRGAKAHERTSGQQAPDVVSACASCTQCGRQQRQAQARWSTVRLTRLAASCRSLPPGWPSRLSRRSSAQPRPSRARAEPIFLCSLHQSVCKDMPGRAREKSSITCFDLLLHGNKPDLGPPCSRIRRRRWKLVDGLCRLVTIFDSNS